jgi:hypothetical protein
VAAGPFRGKLLKTVKKRFSQIAGATENRLQLKKSEAIRLRVGGTADLRPTSPSFTQVASVTTPSTTHMTGENSGGVSQ